MLHFHSHSNSHSLTTTTFLLLLSLLLHQTLTISSNPQPHSIHLKLLHKPASPKSLFFASLHRQNLVRSTVRRNSRGPQCEESSPVSSDQAFQMPIGSGAYTGTGHYFVRVRVGTPARPYLLVADTGSDLTWVKCRYGQTGTKGGGKSIFWPEKSESWQAIKCDTEMCFRACHLSQAGFPM